MTPRCMHFLKIRRCPANILLLQADPSITNLLTFKAINRLSPSTYAKLRLTQPGYPLESPFRTTCSTFSLIPLMRRCDSRVIQAWSLCAIPSANSRNRRQNAPGDAQHPCTRLTAQPARRSTRYVLVAATCRPLSSKAGVRFYIIACAKTALTAISCLAILAASPMPTASEAGSVPLRKPLSCPPPLRMGSNRTRGRLLT